MDPTLPSADFPSCRCPSGRRRRPAAGAAAPPPPAPRRRFRWWRVLRALIAFGFLVVAGSVIALVFGLYLGATGRNLPMLRAAVSVSRPRRRRPAHDGGGDARRAAPGGARAHRRGDAHRACRHRGPPAPLLPPQRRAAPARRLAGRRRRRAHRAARPCGSVPSRSSRSRDRSPPASAQITLAYGGQVKPGGLTGSGAVIQADDVILTAADFWYPSDVQGAFDADVEVTLPADLTLVHNGREEQRIVEGTSARVRFTSERPSPGWRWSPARYQRHAREDGDHRYQLFLPPGSDLDPEKVLESMVVAERGLAEHFGAVRLRPAPRSTSPQPAARRSTTAAACSAFRRATSTTAATAMRASRTSWRTTGGRDGRREVARPGTGGEWIVEGFAQYSSWRAVGERFGQPAFVRALRSQLLRSRRDRHPRRDLGRSTNGLDSAGARDDLHMKGGYVTYPSPNSSAPTASTPRARVHRRSTVTRPPTTRRCRRSSPPPASRIWQPFFATWVRSTASDRPRPSSRRRAGAAVRNLRGAPRARADRVVAQRQRRTGATATTCGRRDGRQTSARSGCCSIRSPPSPTCSAATTSCRGWTRRGWSRSRRTATCWSWTREPVAPGSRRRCGSPRRRVRRRTTWALRSLASPPSRRGAPTARAARALESARGRTADVAGAALGDGGRQTLGHDRIAAADGDGNRRRARGPPHPPGQRPRTGADRTPRGTHRRDPARTERRRHRLCAGARPGDGAAPAAGGRGGEPRAVHVEPPARRSGPGHRTARACSSRCRATGTGSSGSCRSTAASRAADWCMRRRASTGVTAAPATATRGRRRRPGRSADEPDDRTEVFRHRRPLQPTSAASTSRRSPSSTPRWLDDRPRSPVITADARRSAGAAGAATGEADLSPTARERRGETAPRIGTDDPCHPGGSVDAITPRVRRAMLERRRLGV